MATPKVPPLRQDKTLTSNSEKQLKTFSAKTITSIAERSSTKYCG